MRFFIIVSVPYEITLLSNYRHCSPSWYKVSVPYEITLLSNGKCCLLSFIIVSVPYEITLLSNLSSGTRLIRRFQYLMKLHYSQTSLSNFERSIAFQYLMKLHYSQTSNKLRHYNAQGNNIRYIYYTI